MSSLEIHKKEMENEEVMEALSKHLNGDKITRIKLSVLADQLTETNKSLPKLNKSASKNEIINWYKSNWKSIYPNLCVFGCIAPNGSEVTDTEDDLFFMETENLWYINCESFLHTTQFF